MAWNEALDEESFSVAFGTQSDINTVAVSWTFIDCEMPQVSYDAAQTEQKRSRRSRGAGTKRLTGKVWPRVAIRFPACGQLATYDHTSDTPGLKGQMGLLNFFGGSSGLAYTAACVTPTDGNTWAFVSNVGKIGCLAAALESGGSVEGMGFIESLAGGGLTVTLFEDTAAQPGAATALLPSFTAYPTTGSWSPLSIRVCGEDTGMERIYLGCVLSRVTQTFDADWRPYFTAEFVAYGGETRGASGGLQTVTDCLAIEPLLERGGARFVIASDVFTDLDDGTVDPDGTCGVRNWEVTWDFPHFVVECPPKREGVGDIVIRPPTITCAFSLPDVSDYEDGGEHFGEKAWRDGTSFSASLYMGDTPGRILAMNLPALHLTSYPAPIQIDGVRHRRFECEAGHHAGDGASTDAGNKPLRFSVA